MVIKENQILASGPQKAGAKENKEFLAKFHKNKLKAPQLISIA